MNTLPIGTPTKILDALTSTADTTSTVYALPSNWASLGRPLVWQSVFGGSPSAISLQFQGAMNNIEAEYAVIDSSTSTDGEMRHVQPLGVRFVRVRQVSRTGGTSVTVTINI
jgi:hypothetical protein